MIENSHYGYQGLCGRNYGRRGGYSGKIDRYIKTIYNKANDMNRLINELTYYSGIDSNKIPYNFHRINVAEFFRIVLKILDLTWSLKTSN